jgi:transcriptional regulator with XRE-family HTH domain
MNFERRDWLKFFRKKKNLTQAEAAQRIKIGRPYYASIESGSRDPSLQVALEIAKVLEFDPKLFKKDQRELTRIGDKL